MSLQWAMSGLLLLGRNEAPNKAPWLEDLAVAQQVARRSGKLIFAVLH